MDELVLSIIGQQLNDARTNIRKALRTIEVCNELITTGTLLHQKITPTEVKTAFAWIDHSNLSPKEILNKVLT